VWELWVFYDVWHDQISEEAIADLIVPEDVQYVLGSEEYISL
jgi:hypothetical protein